MKIPRLLSQNEVLTFLGFYLVYTSQTESISVLLVKIGCTLNKLLWGYNFLENSCLSEIEIWRFLRSSSYSIC
jgi:hypothetical protein